MDYEIIALDIDGTLVNSQKQITDRTYDTLINLQKSGKKVVLASGRPIQGIMPYAEKLKLSKYGGYVLAYNGGCVYDVAQDEKVFSKDFPLECIPEICDIIKDTGVTVNTYENDLIISGNRINKYSYIERDIIKLDMKFVDDFASYVNFPINKLLLAGEPEEIVALEKILGTKFKGKLSVFRSEPFFLEVVPLGIDKAESMDKLLKSLDLTKDNCIACGDGYNDVSMIKYAGLGVAMENASDTVKSAADYITVSNDCDGVARVVEKFMM